MDGLFERLMQDVRTFSGKLRKIFSGWPRFVRYPAICLLSLFIAFIIADIIFPYHPQVVYSQIVLDKNGDLLHASLTPDQKWRMRCDLSEVSPQLISTLIRKEDRWFRYHPGVNPLSVARALWQNLIQGERISGASTITMQVVRMQHPRSRTIGNKLIEMFNALQLEFHYRKSSILELYFNLLPYGGNIEGVKAASYLYFGQKPVLLSPARIATLAIIPNNPRHLRIGVNNEQIRKERNNWLLVFRKQGIFSGEELRTALLEPLEASRLQAPREIPHFAGLLRKIYPSTSELHTFIDPAIQQQVEDILASEIGHLRSVNIGNGAVVVINNRTMAVEAYAGSAGFNETFYQGQVDGCNALRSPGSALKPFLYALAIDNGTITPRMMLSDVPMNFNGYKPQNYDAGFRGQVTASQALALSLNLPAVELANRIGVELFLNKLSRGGLKWIGKRKSTLGLSVVLGGCGVNLLELTGLYSALAREGRHSQTRLIRDETNLTYDSLFSPEAAWLITDMLTNLKRPDLPTNFENSLHLPHIAWKTGTSYGRRDAWSIGYNPDYTVGVWVGNFDGSGSPDLSGSESASPILFRIFNMLTMNRQSRWFPKPERLDYRLVCSESGLPPNDFCQNLVMDYFLPGISPNRKCTHLTEVFTNPSATTSYCRNCLPATGYRVELYPNLSPALIAFFEEEHISYSRIPPHNPECNRVFRDEMPVITSLNDGKEYIFYSGSEQELQLACNAAADVTKVFWYVDDHFAGQTKASEKLFFKPRAGKVKISCCDDKGRNTDIFITVTFL